MFQHPWATPAYSLGSFYVGSDRPCSAEPGFGGVGLARPYVASGRSGETGCTQQGSISLSWMLSGRLSTACIHPTSMAVLAVPASWELRDEVLSSEQKSPLEYSQCRETEFGREFWEVDHPG